MYLNENTSLHFDFCWTSHIYNHHHSWYNKTLYNFLLHLAVQGMTYNKKTSHEHIYLFNLYHHVVQNIQQCDEPTHPRIGLLLHHWGPCPLLFLNSRVDSLTSHKKQMSESPVRWDPTVFCPYPRRLQSLTVFRCHCKGSTFLSVI